MLDSPQATVGDLMFCEVLPEYKSMRQLEVGGGERRSWLKGGRLMDDGRQEMPTSESGGCMNDS